MGQGEGLKPADCALAKAAHTRDLQVGQRRAHVCLGHPQLDPPLLEPLGEGLQLPGVRLRLGAGDDSVGSEAMGVGHVHRLGVVGHVVDGRHVGVRV